MEKSHEVLTGRNRIGRVIISVLTAAVMTLIVVIGVSTFSAASSASASDSRSDMFNASPEALRKGAEELQQNVASGWVPYDAMQSSDGPVMHGWVPMGADVSAFLRSFDQTEARLPVFAQKGGGEVLGYIYEYVGFVPAELDDSGSFDAHAARSKAAGCDPVLADGSTDADCAALTFKALTN